MKLFLITRVVPFVLQLFVRFIYLTSKKVFHHPEIDSNEPFIVTFWHGELLMQPFNYKKIKPKGKVSAMISEHKDGEAITRTVEYLGIDSIRGSSTRGGAKALIGAIKELKAGDDIAITPDGPRGPRHSVADGIVAISQKTNARILIFNCKPTKYWQFNSWDKFIVPKPFGKLEFFIQEPFDLNSLEIDEAKELIKKKLLLNSME
ncbi:lysophospholipid acyltransferase family protein [Halarcobacter sp.]|uniref:lysophospholipid acyltransferase family protein n=1 Tax=Halarcobacter sp. TaxID=2321133 RepID=UPI002AABE204|nr:lysophospholipid acyltransferase family protein [Halarcobacter sp.]